MVWPRNQGVNREYDAKSEQPWTKPCRQGWKSCGRTGDGCRNVTCTFGRPPGLYGGLSCADSFFAGYSMGKLAVATWSQRGWVAKIAKGEGDIEICHQCRNEPRETGWGSVRTLGPILLIGAPVDMLDIAFFLPLTECCRCCVWLSWWLWWCCQLLTTPQLCHLCQMKQL